jgi:hypothetical protein
MTGGVAEVAGIAQVRETDQLKGAGPERVHAVQDTAAMIRMIDNYARQALLLLVIVAQNMAQTD